MNAYPGLLAVREENCLDNTLRLTPEGQATFPGLSNAAASHATPWHTYFVGNPGNLGVLMTGKCRERGFNCEDPSRTIYRYGEQACRVFDGDPASCAKAWHRTDDGVSASCWYAAGECRGCGPNQQTPGNCINTCVTCSEDPNRNGFVGIDDGSCEVFDGNPAGCESAWYFDDDGLPHSCEYDGGGGNCGGCEVVNGAACNTCAPTCEDSSRTFFVGDENDCDSQTTAAECNVAWYSDDDTGLPATCYFAGGQCRACDVNDEDDGDCTNTCHPAKTVAVVLGSGGGPLSVELASFTADRTSTGVRIRWSTAVEIDNFGFRVMREVASSVEKAPLYISPMIPAKGSSLVGAEYEFVDTGKLPSGEEIAYFLEDVDSFGRTSLHGPVTVIVGKPVRQRMARDESADFGESRVAPE